MTAATVVQDMARSENRIDLGNAMTNARGLLVARDPGAARCAVNLLGCERDKARGMGWVR